jgi:hypothetical protein
VHRCAYDAHHPSPGHLLSDVVRQHLVSGEGKKRRTPQKPTAGRAGYMGLKKVPLHI